MIKYYGLVTATIDETRKRIKLEYSKRGKQPLDRGHPERCLSWALAALADYQDRGYIFETPGAVKSG